MQVVCSVGADGKPRFERTGSVGQVPTFSSMDMAGTEPPASQYNRFSSSRESDAADSSQLRKAYSGSEFLSVEYAPRSLLSVLPATWSRSLMWSPLNLFSAVRACTLACGSCIEQAATRPDERCWGMVAERISSRKVVCVSVWVCAALAALL